MDCIKAAAKAFRNCRGTGEKSRTVASYLAKQYLIGSGAKFSEIVFEMMPEVDRLLDEWFAQRSQDAAFVPTIDGALRKIETSLPVIDLEDASDV